MLKSLTLRNYRCFREHDVPLAPFTVLVGRNNAGKSTVAEALRLVALVTRRFKNFPYNKPGPQFDLPIRSIGIAPSIDNIELDFTTMFHRYRDPPAEITARFENGATVHLTVVQNKLHAVIRDEHGKLIESQAAARKLDLSHVAILPQIGPLVRDEKLLKKEYVLRNVDSRVSHLHFRNQIYQMREEHFENFRRAVEATWPGLALLDIEFGEHGISLGVRDHDFVSEVGAMGHGLQMWLQMMWFLTRERNSDVVILDEPDVYMHADLQRRLIRHIRAQFDQVLITTHSTEIMSEVEPDNILVIDRDRPSSDFAPSVPAVQALVTRLGSVHNIGLTRLWRANKLLFIEGDDAALLKRIHRALLPGSESSFDTIPAVAIGGWGGWPYAIGSSLLLRNSAGEAIQVYCILDSDYFPLDTIRGRLDEARKRQVHLHIWHRKEIENYLLVPSLIRRHVAEKLPRRVSPPTEAEVTSKIEEIAKLLEDNTFDQIAHEINSASRKYGQGGANKEARRRLAERISACGPSGVVSGKEVLSQLSAWTQRDFGVSLSSVALAATMRHDEVLPELRQVVTAIEHGRELPKSPWLESAP